MAIAVATYNSARYFENLSKSIDAQRPGLGKLAMKLEVHCFDGGSDDSTIASAKLHGWLIHENSEGDPISAKTAALNTLPCDYICFLDHDELFINANSLARRIEYMESNVDVVAAFPSGYDPAELSESAKFGTQFGDIFSALYFKSVNDSRYRSASLVDSGFEIDPICDGVLVHQLPIPRRVLLEPAAGACIVRANMARTVTGASRHSDLLPNLLYLRAPGVRVAHFDSDPILHVSNDSWATLAMKQDWRVHQAFRAESAGVRARPASRLSLLLASLSIFLGASLVFPVLRHERTLRERGGSVGFRSLLRIERFFVRSVVSAVVSKFSARSEDLSLTRRYGR